MKERPILFSGSMVRALLAGTKTQTRRAFSPRMEKLMRAAAAMGEVSHFLDEGSMQPNDLDYVRSFCPYGQPGDKLWVREAFMHEPADYCWEASVSIPCRPAETAYRADFPNSQPGEGWKPSIHMPRNLSRILLEITGVRVERLQDISEADALAEGVPHSLNLPGGRFARENFEHLWWTINGDGSWESNPWVWVVEFKRVQQASSGRPSQLEDAPCSA
ncbi:hypothetical protein [Delftia acidovorans]|uniref:hypothetical protein n=1 Tax=Delftia acidovorans TaxID=80866 RepID=UPI003A5BA979